MFSSPGTKWPISAALGAAASSESAVIAQAAIRFMAATLAQPRLPSQCPPYAPRRSEREGASYRQLKIVALRSVAIRIFGRLLDAIPDEAHVEVEGTPDLEREH